MTDDQPERDQEASPPPEEPAQQEGTQEAQQPASPEPEGEPQGEDQGRSREDALAEVRQSLREEEQAKKPGFFARLRGLFRRRKEEPEPEEPEPGLEIPELRLEKPAPPRPPVTVETQAPPAAEPEAAPPAPVAEPPPAEPPVPVFTPMGVGPREEEAPPEPPKSSILKTLHEEGTEEQPVDYAAMRGEALEGYAEQPEEPVEETQVSMRRTLRRTWRDMRPFERTLITSAIGFMIIVVVIVIGYIGLKATGLLPAAPVPTSTPSDLPYPISVSLPGGWDFTLRPGRVEGPRWEPKGAEWLEGTELCRWVSLPYSVQLEAVIRTLKANDEITLTMSNYDKLIYKVKSREQVSADQIQGLQTPEPCLLVILSNPDSDQRWVIVANP